MPKAGIHDRDREEAKLINMWIRGKREFTNEDLYGNTMGSENAFNALIEVGFLKRKKDKVVLANKPSKIFRYIKLGNRFIEINKEG